MSVTVPVTEVPPVTEAGLKLTPLTVGARTVTLNELVLVPSVPVIRAIVLTATAVVETLK